MKSKSVKTCKDIHYYYYYYYVLFFIMTLSLLPPHTVMELHPIAEICADHFYIYLFLLSVFLAFLKLHYPTLQMLIPFQQWCQVHILGYLSLSLDETPVIKRLHWFFFAVIKVVFYLHLLKRMFLFTWKEAVYVPVLKKDSDTIMIKDWPISFLNTFYKVRLPLLF